MLNKRVLTATTFLFVAVLFFLFFYKSANQPTPTPTHLSQLHQIDLPVRIKIPVINLDTLIEYVDIAADGSMDVPKTAMNVAWYRLGPRPGEIGSAVIDGHVDWKDGTKAVFTDLHKLKPGDKISIIDTQGRVISFLVKRTEIYAANVDDTSIFLSNDGISHLNLITCSGDWDYKSQNYSQRLIVFADKE